MDNAVPGPLKVFKDKLSAEIIEIPAIFQSTHFPGLDGLRALAVITVIFSHIAFPTAYLFYFNGNIGVQIFFVISGFLITTLLIKEKVRNGKMSFTKFYIRRALRILPVAYLFLIVVFILNYPLNLGVTVKGFIVAFLFLRNIPLRGVTDWCTGHFWTLAIEEQFYLLFPFFIVYKTNKYIAVGLLMMLTLLILKICGIVNLGIYYFTHFTHLPAFILTVLLGRGTFSILTGSLCSIFVFKKVLQPEKLSDNYFLSFFLLVFCILISVKRSFIYLETVSEIILPILTAWVILLNLKGKNFLRIFLENKLIVKIGILSYSLYVWQQIFTIELFNFIKGPFSIPVRLLLLILVSVISYYGFERYFLKFKAKYKA